MAFIADFEEHFLSQQFSDVTVVIQNETEALGKRRRVKALPAHSMVLMAFSKYFKTQLQLQSWSEAGAVRHRNSTTPQRFEIDLPVPAGQQDLAELLVKGIYQKQPSITADLSHDQLLRLLLLADRFEVTKVQAAVLQALSEVPAEQLHWHTALDLLDLPAVCPEQPEQFKAMQDAAMKRLLHELGDLEAAWASEQLQQQLLGPPVAALKRLLQHSDTRVASENTVVYTIEQWYEGQPPRQRRKAQLQELMRLVRLPHCSLYYISTIMMHSKLVTSCFTQAELAVAQLIRSDPAAPTVYQEGKSPLLDRFPAWTAGKRPASSKEQAIVWHLPLSDLQSAAEEVLQGSAAPEVAKMSSSSHVLQGQQFVLRASVESNNTAGSHSSTSASCELAVDLYIVCEELAPSAVRKVSATFTVAAVKTAETGLQSGRDIVKTLPASGFSNIVESWGYQMITLAEVSSWEAAEKVLRAKQLVHSAGHAGQAEPHLSIRVDILELE